MTTYNSETSGTFSGPPVWVRVLLGIVLILGGILVLGDVALATFISTLLIGFTAIVVGAFEILHAFWTKGWGGFIWQVLLGLLYIVFGWMVVYQPVSGALILTFMLGLVFLASGIVRIYRRFQTLERGRLADASFRRVRHRGRLHHPFGMAGKQHLGARASAGGRSHHPWCRVADLWLADGGQNGVAHET